MLTLFLGWTFTTSFGAIIVSGIATSSGAAATYVRDRPREPARWHVPRDRHDHWRDPPAPYLAGILSAGLLYLIFAC